MQSVRQSFRILWRCARIDRQMFAKVITGPPPLRLVQCESRLLEHVEGIQG
jgi:hypothetical protein